MVSRRKFIQGVAIGTAAFKMRKPLSLFKVNEGKRFSYESPYLKLELYRDSPAFSFFSTDNLGGGNFSGSPLLTTQPPSTGNWRSETGSDRIDYFSTTQARNTPAWQFSLRPNEIIVRTRWNGEKIPAPVKITFSQKANPVTVLGIIPEKNVMRFPCVLHLPGMGSFRVHCSDPHVTLFYDADRDVKNPFVQISFSPADKEHPDILYRLESVAIYPEFEKIKGDARFDGFRRSYINIYQMNPRTQVLANNSASDNCTFTVFLYAEMARHTPELAEGLTAMHLVRNTLDKYIAGMKGYGQVGYDEPYNKYIGCDSSDSAPSLIISACDYITHSKDVEWAKQNYDAIKRWATRMIATDTNHDGLVKYCHSGNSGSWVGHDWKSKDFVRPANWWDTIGFGYEDAYSNALAYRACNQLSEVARSLGHDDDSRYFTSFANKMKSIYYSTFYDPKTGVLGGWRSADGELHDYYFTFVNSVAICYGLIEREEGVKILQTLLRKIKEVGYPSFGLGLPGNLIPVADKDYVSHNPGAGYQSFQVYENGGATGAFVYFMIHALYKLDMREEAEQILFPMLKSYKTNGFQGFCANSDRSRDWKTWKGECWGYEGFLVDSYLAFLNVEDYVESV